MYGENQDAKLAARAAAKQAQEKHEEEAAAAAAADLRNAKVGWPCIIYPWFWLGTLRDL